MLRLANADVLPLRTEDFAAAVSHYVDEIETTAQAMRRATEEEGLLQQMHIYELARSHNDPAEPPTRDAEVPYLNFAPLRNSVSLLMQSSRRFDNAALSVTRTSADVSAAQLTVLNATLRTLEQSLLGTPGLAGRPWYRHVIYAPGTYTGYGVKTLPAVREAVEERQFKTVDEAVKQAADALDAYRLKLDETTRLLSGAGK